MPYTESELTTVSFYQDFVSKLRNQYFDKIKESMRINFRKDGVLYSFEDIFTGLGIEDVITTESSDYSFLYTEDYSRYPAWLVALMKKYPDITLQPEIIDHRKKAHSIVRGKDVKYPVYEKGEVLDKVINREISELVTPSTVDGTLPEGINNGDRVAVESDFEDGDADNDVNVWLIEGNKKRKYQDKFAFFSSGYSKSTVTLLSESEIDSIIDGEDIQIGWRGWNTEKGSEGRY
jgi:hypothetical protein